MKLDEMVITLTAPTAKKAAKTLSAFKKRVKAFGKAEVEMKLLSPTSVEIVADFQHWLSPESIEDVYTEMEYTIKKSDADGHILSVEVGNGVGSNFVEAILSGLRPGMPVKAEAFFPTIAFVVKWKNMMK